jgi:tetratricopeptide (TPR) repeat protein
MKKFKHPSPPRWLPGRHSRESGNPVPWPLFWTPAFAGVTALGIVVLCMGADPVRAGAPVAGTAEEVTHRLQHSIDVASERGNYSQLQSLRLELAQHYAAIGSFALAARQYELLLASRPGRHERVDFSIELGKMRDADHDYDRAIAALQDAVHDDEKSWDANFNLARAYDHAELNSKAVEIYKTCIALKPERYEAYSGIAHVYQQLGFLSRAVAYYQKALARESRPELYLALADAYARQGDVARARDILQQAKTLLPRADYDVRLGEIFRRSDDLKRACAAWEEALKVDPRRGDVKLDLALAYERLKRSAESDRLFRQLLAAYPRSALVHFSRAWSLYSRGDPYGARVEAQIVERLAPTAVVQHYNEQLLAELRKRS